MKEIQLLIETGYLDEALAEIGKFNSLQQLDGKILKSKIMYLKGAYQEADTLAMEALDQSLDEGRNFKELQARLEKSYALFGMQQYEACKESLDTIQHLLQSTSYPADTYQKVRRLEAKMHNIRGLRYRYLGELDQAMDAYKTSYEIRSKLGNKYDIAGSLTNIGTIYQMRGELDLAIEYHQRAREIFEELNNQQMLAYTLHDIASTFWEKNDFEQARNFYDNALDIRINLSHHQNTARTLLDLVLLHIDFDYIDLSRYYLDILKEIHTNHYNDLIDIFFSLARAAVLQTSARLVQRAEAQQIYIKLQERSLPYEFAVFVKLSLCNLYLFDLKISKNEDLINEVEEIIRGLLKLSKTQYSTIVLVETLLLQAKLALIGLDLETSQTLLFQAEFYANQKNLHHLAYKVSEEHDMIVDKIYKWETLQKRNASLIERLEAVNFEQDIDYLRSRRTRLEFSREAETPLFLLILNQDAIRLYSKKFNEDVEINHELIGSYLIASDRGMASALNNQGSIERIKYGGHQLIFIHQDNMMFCYGFMGRSYFAIKRLNDFIDHIRLGRAWQMLRASVPKPKEIQVQIQSKVDDYFSPDGIYSMQFSDNSEL